MTSCAFVGYIPFNLTVLSIISPTRVDSRSKVAPPFPDDTQRCSVFLNVISNVGMASCVFVGYIPFNLTVLSIISPTRVDSRSKVAPPFPDDTQRCSVFLNVISNVGMASCVIVGYIPFNLAILSIISPIRVDSRSKAPPLLKPYNAVSCKEPGVTSIINTPIPNHHIRAPYNYNQYKRQDIRN